MRDRTGLPKPDKRFPGRYLPVTPLTQPNAFRSPDEQRAAVPAWQRANERLDGYVKELAEQRLGQARMRKNAPPPNTIETYSSRPGGSLSEPKNSFANPLPADSAGTKTIASRNQRQNKRRKEKREAKQEGVEWEGRRPSMNDRLYTSDNNAFIVECHKTYAAKKKGARIPEKILLEEYIERFPEEEHTMGGLRAQIRRVPELKELRMSFKGR